MALIRAPLTSAESQNADPVRAHWKMHGSWPVQNLPLLYWESKISLRGVPCHGRIIPFPVSNAFISISNINDQLHTVHCALSLAAQCTVIGLVCGGRAACLWVCYHYNSKLRTHRFDRHQTGFAGKGSNHLQLIKFWPSRTPGKGVCSGAKIFDSALLQPACSVCVSPSAFSFYMLTYTYHTVTQTKRMHR